MEPTAASFAAAIEAVVRAEPDVADVLAHLVADCARVTSVDTCALMAMDGNGELSLLAAESHRAVEMELLQIQRSAGPCVDVIDSGRPLHVVGREAITERWGDVGQAVVDAGFEAVEANPMRWRGTVLGGLNIFRVTEDHSALGPL